MSPPHHCGHRHCRCKARQGTQDEPHSYHPVFFVEWSMCPLGSQSKGWFRFASSGVYISSCHFQSNGAPRARRGPPTWIERVLPKVEAIVHLHSSETTRAAPGLQRVTDNSVVIPFQRSLVHRATRKGQTRKAFVARDRDQQNQPAAVIGWRAGSVSRRESAPSQDGPKQSARFPPRGVEARHPAPSQFPSSEAALFSDGP